MERIAVFPGSFDPFTIGHESIVRRALNLFDRIIIAIGINTNKTDFFPLEKRLQWIKEVFEYEEKVSVMSYTGLTVDFCRKQNARFIIRGLRTSADFEYERSIAQVNRAMADDIETIFILTLPEHTAITSTLVRDILRHGGDASKFLPNSKDLKNLRIH
ncbi:MAG: pantetheine-phosphate adenylyltransferase [Bacteroidales bacterium]|nr:pantetheine-phosphate adenylyltransferase [Bacteroidales bacterium]HOK98269.1 pantetheine-phosphate adenylyltransferase [Bacteroidales bacterium]HPO65175.1 pantetheine-phosphate adenylyltransferase [Bacteroidales bacterium]